MKLIDEVVRPRRRSPFPPARGHGRRRPHDLRAADPCRPAGHPARLGQRGLEHVDGGRRARGGREPADRRGAAHQHGLPDHGRRRRRRPPRAACQRCEPRRPTSCAARPRRSCGAPTAWPSATRSWPSAGARPDGAARRVPAAVLRGRPAGRRVRRRGAVRRRDRARRRRARERPQPGRRDQRPDRARRDRRHPRRVCARGLLPARRLRPVLELRAVPDVPGRDLLGAARARSSSPPPAKTPPRPASTTPSSTTSSRCRRARARCPCAAWCIPRPRGRSSPGRPSPTASSTDGSAAGGRPRHLQIAELARQVPRLLQGQPGLLRIAEGDVAHLVLRDPDEPRAVVDIRHPSSSPLAALHALSSTRVTRAR